MTPLDATAPHILVVDDAPDLVSFVAFLLSDEGYRVQGALTLAEAQQALRDRPPDLVITDVRMPGVAPFAVLDLADADARLAELPVLVCTGATHELTDHAARLQRPRRRVLAKPFDIDELVHCVAQLLRERRDGATGHAADAAPDD